MTIPKIAKNSNEVENSQDLVNLIQVLFHDTELLDKLLFTLNQNCFGSLPHPDRVIPPNTKVYNFILPFFKNASSIFQNELVMEKILSDIKELLINSTNLKEDVLYDSFELALKSASPNDRKALFSKVLDFKQEFKTEDAYYELLGHLSLLNYYCNEGKCSFLRLKALIFLYAFDFSEFWKGNLLHYDSALVQKLSNLQPLPLLLKIKFISSSLQETLEMLGSSFSEDLLELLEFQLLVINSTCQIAKGNKSVSRESYYDLFLEGELSIWSQLYEFIENNKGKLEKITSKHQFLLFQYDSLLGEWIDFIRNFQEESFIINKENGPVRIIPKYQELHLKYLNQLLLLLTTSLSKSSQESIIGLLNKAVSLDTSYLSKLDLKRIFSLAEQQILGKFLPNLNKTSSSAIQVFPRLLRVIESCFKSVHPDLLNNDDYAFLSEMQNSKLFKKLFALYEKNPKIASNITERSKLNDYLSIIHFFMQLLKYLSAIYTEKKSYRSKFIEIMQDLLSSELQLIDQVQYSIIATDLMGLFDKIKFFTRFQDKQTIFLYLKFWFFQPQYKITANNFYEFQSLKNAYQQIIESHPEHKTLLAEMMILLLNAHGRKVQDSGYNLWEELRKIENDIVEENHLDFSLKIQKEFIFPIDSKVSENTNLELYQDLVKGMTYKSLVMSCFVSRRFDDFTPENFHLILDMIKACSRVVMSPLLIFLTPFCIYRAQNYFNEFCSQKEGQVNTFIESLIIGINKTFETFKLNDEKLFCEISISNISTMFSEISEKGFLSIETIPNDLTWREAAIASLVLMLRLYGGYFRNNKPHLHADFSPEFYSEFLKANQNLKILFEKYLRKISRDKDFSQDWRKNLSVLSTLFEKWGGFCYVINHRYSFRTMVEDVYKTWICGFDFSSDNQEKKIAFAYNVGILNNFLNIFFLEGWEFHKKDLVQTLSTTEIFQHLLSLQNQMLSLKDDDKSLELHFLNNQLPHFFKSFYNPIEFQTVHLENTNYETQAVKNFAAIKQVLSNKNLLAILNTNNKPLIKNLNGLIDCCFDMYRIYDNYSSNKVKKIEAQLVLVKAKNSKNKEIQDEEEDMGFGMFEDPDEENYPESAVAQEEEDPFGGFNVDDELVQLEEAGKDEKVDNEVIELEQSMKGFLGECKDEVESFLQSCLPNLLYFTGLDDRLLNFKINSSTIPKTFWPNQYESLYKTTLLYVAGFLKSEDEKVVSASLEKEAANIEKPSLDINIFTFKSSIPAQDELMTLNLLYNLMAKFFTSNVTRSLNFSSDCIHGLVSATNSRLKELMGNLPESRHQTQFFNDLAKFLQDLAKLAIHLIVTTVSKTYCIVNNHDSSFNCFLVLALELIENSLLIQEIAVSDFNVGLLEQEEKNFDKEITVATTLIQLANVTLAANKNLRISFVQKGLLEKLLTAKRFTLWTRKEADAILSLFATILEDCFPFETQVELVIKEFINEKNKSDLSLNSLLNFSKFLPFKDHPQSLNPLKAYASIRKSNVNQLTLKDFGIQDPIGKAFLIDYTKSHDKVNAIEYLQRAVSPLTQKSIQTLLRAFFQNLAFEKNLIQQKISQETPLKEIKSLLELLASIMYNFPYLTPYIIFQEFKDLAQEKTLLDVLLTFALERDSESALFLVGSLLKDQSLYVVNSGEQIKNVFLLKIFGIINNMLDIENSQNEAFSSFETTSMRFHIAQVLAFINKQVHSEEGFENKDKVNELISITTQKLLKNIKNAFKLIAEMSVSRSNFIFEISQIVDISMAGLAVPKSTKDYVNFLKAIEKESNTMATDKSFLSDEKFNQFIFKYEEKIFQQTFQEDLNEEELKKYETQKFYMTANIENKSDFTLHFPITEFTEISGQLLNFSRLRGNLEYQNQNHSQYFRKYIPESSQIIDYLNHYRNQSPIFSQMPQPFHERLDPNRSNYFKKLQIFPSQNPIPFNNLKISTSPYSAFLQEEQIKLEKVLKETPISENKEQIKTNEEVVDEIKPPEEVKQESQDANPKPVGPEEYQAYDSEGMLKVDYFVLEIGNNEMRPLDFFVNKALQKARRLKEIIQLEKVYDKMVHKEETNPAKIKEIVNDFTKNLADFNKSILYTALGKEIRTCLSHEMQAEIKIMEKQLKAIKEDICSYYEANALLLQKRKNEPGYKPNGAIEEVKDQEDEYYDEYYDEFDYDDFRFLKENQQNEQRKEETLSDDESVPVLVEKEDLETIKTVRAFKLDDMTVMELCMSFFGDYSKSSASLNPIIQFSTFLNNSLFKNPANELKVLDTLLFILYTPELLKETDELPYPLKSLLNNLPQQQITAKNIIEHLSLCINNSPTKSFIYLTPITYLTKFGNQLLANLKEKTGFSGKTKGCYSALDLIIGSLENKMIIKDEENVQKILDAIKSILASDNQIALGRGDPNDALTYKNYISSKNLRILFSLISDDFLKIPYKNLSDLMESFKSQPKLLISFQDDVIDVFSSNARSLNKIIEPSLAQDDFEKALSCLHLTKQAKTVEIFLRCFTSVCHKFCITEKFNQKVASNLQNLIQTLFNPLNVK